MDKAIIMSDLLCHLALGYRLLVVILDNVNRAEYLLYIYFLYLWYIIFTHIRRILFL